MDDYVGKVVDMRQRGFDCPTLYTLYYSFIVRHGNINFDVCLAVLALYNFTSCQSCMHATWHHCPSEELWLM